MNRIIKFRAWDEKKKKMAPVSNMNWTSTGWDVCCFENGMHTGRLLLQFIGLKDKNDVEIYEGDFVIYSKPTKDGKKQSAAVISYESIGQWFNGLYAWEIQDIEVIGNIYENPLVCIDKLLDLGRTIL